MSKKSKNIGNAFEYRVAHWFENRKGWHGLRNPLSGASEQINNLVSKHDVRAWHDTLPLFLQIECKKRSKVSDPKKRDQIEVKREWIDKIDFNKDEILVLSTDRSDIYVFIDLKRFFEVLGRSFDIIYEKSQIYTGTEQFVFKRESVDNSPDKRYFLHWLEREWVVLLLDEFVTLRETANLIDSNLSFEDQIRRLTTLDKGTEFEKANLDSLTYSQKQLLYTKLTELESGIIMNPIDHAQDQFWLDEAFVCICPFCEKKITTKDLKEKGDEESPPEERST